MHHENAGCCYTSRSPSPVVQHPKYHWNCHSYRKISQPLATRPRGEAPHDFHPKRANRRSSVQHRTMIWKHVSRLKEPSQSSFLPDGHPLRISPCNGNPCCNSPKQEAIRISGKSEDESTDWESDDPIALSLRRAIDTVRQERRAMLQRFSKINEEIKTLQREFEDHEECDDRLM